MLGMVITACGPSTARTSSISARSKASAPVLFAPL